MSNADQTSNVVTLLFTCVGRRVELLQAFRAASGRLGIPVRLVGVDSDSTAPALYAVDEAVIVPRASDPGYAPTLLDIVRRTGAKALIPTTDTDLPIVSARRDTFAQAGCTALIASQDVIKTCRDKILTYQHLSDAGIDTPKTFTPEQFPTLQPPPPFPLFLKPRTGSASQWVHRINDRLDLDYFSRRVADPIIQEFIEGVEHTLDVYVGLDGRPRCVVPRARWQVRTGEVCKGVVVKDHDVMQAGKRVVESLGDSCRGVVTLQCIVTAERRICFIEINPRFGGGAPMAIAAGADYPGWLLRELRGDSPEIAFDGFEDGLCMLRYDWSVFAPVADAQGMKLGQARRRIPDFE